MGKTSDGADANATKPFTNNDVNNRYLVISMLKYEEALVRSDFGQTLYNNPLNRPLVTLNVEKSINRLTLSHFGYDTTDNSVANYRSIFRHYYRSPTDYDKEVLDSVHYMRENKCVYYTKEPLKVGQLMPNCRLFTIDGTTQVNLHDVIQKEAAKYTVVAAFSLS